MDTAAGMYQKSNSNNRQGSLILISNLTYLVGFGEFDRAMVHILARFSGAKYPW